MDPSYQDRLIKHYYENLDTIMLHKLSELVSELYIAESPARQRKLWDRARKAMVQLKIPPPIIHLQDWLANTKI
jgi:hypothetical protein